MSIACEPWRTLYLTGLVSALVALLFSCSPDNATDVSLLRVATTTTMLTDLAQQIAGEDAEVTGLMGPSVDPHLYKMTARDGRILRDADLILYNGHYLEGQMGQAFGDLASLGKPVIAVAERLPDELLLAPEDFEGHFDPHVWFDPALWSRVAMIVADAFAEADPDRADRYRGRAVAYQERLEVLARWGEDRIAKIPPERRVLITSHDAYNYFGKRFGFEVVGVQGISTASEAGLADMASLVDFIREREIPAIFVESSVSPRTIERISEDSGAIVGGELFSDAMGVPGEKETVGGETYDLGTYEGMFKHNVNRIVEALASGDST